MDPSADVTERFSNRVEDYVNSRPSYPIDIVKTLDSAFDLPNGCKIADIGSGTGISSRVLLDGLAAKSAQVIGIEPNEAMRKSAETLLAQDIKSQKFISIAATAEATTLADDSVDLIVAGQAFHWFDFPAAKCEFLRILKEPMRVALVWNQWSSRHGGMVVGKTHQATDARFMAAYEALVDKFSPEYRTVNHTSRVNEEVLATFFGGAFETREFPNPYRLTWEQLRGRLLSSSYSPAKGQPGHEEMLGELRECFEQFQDGGTVEFVYTTRLFYGSLR